MRGSRSGELVIDGCDGLWGQIKSPQIKGAGREKLIFHGGERFALLNTRLYSGLKPLEKSPEISESFHSAGVTMPWNVGCCIPLLNVA